MFRTATLLLLIGCFPLRAATTITIFHFSDYHSHATPFYSEGRTMGGIDRAIGFLKRHKSAATLVFNGGDMMNKGAPAWSDRYRCAEWPWLNGVVDAMAFGNHDADYGNDELARCRSLVRYPIVSANTAGFERYRVFERKGIRIGVFAVAGADFTKLVTNAKLTFSDATAAAREVVRTLRDRERVDAVVLIGHEQPEDDFKLVAAVPGIDLVLGTHTHLKQELMQIPGTSAWFISPYQYLTYISEVEMTFDGHKLTSVRGHLVPVDASMKPDSAIARRVARMQRELERDPAYSELFVPIAKLPNAMEVEDVARFALETMRNAVHADLAVSTVSSFRQPLPAGTIDLETLRAALPYDNQIVFTPMTGARLQKLLDASAAAPTDSRLYTTPLPAIEPERVYQVAATDFMAYVSPVYSGIVFDPHLVNAGIRVRAETQKRLRSLWPSTP